MRYDDSNDMTEEQPDKPESKAQSFAFLYTRESDKIGAMVRKDNKDSTHMMGASTGRRSQTRTRLLGADADLPPNNEHVKASPGQILASYKQGTKVEDPRFTTTSNEYGTCSRLIVQSLSS